MRIVVILALLSTFTLCSCDRQKPQQKGSEGDPTTQAAEESIDNRPKAPLALTSTIQLVDYPLSLKVPDKWQLKYGAVTLLEGPTPNGPLPDGTIHLIVSRPGPLPKSAVDALKPATRPTTKDSIAREEMRNLGRLRIYERRGLQPSSDGGPETVKWTISAYEAIDGENVRVYQISFLHLTREHFENDRELLERMVGSLAVVEGGEPSLAPPIK